MVVALKEAVSEGRILFGIKQSLKKSKELNKAYLALDSRSGVRNLLNANKISFEVLQFSKSEIAEKLNLNFECEVFGVKN